jgi:hypothetical protein
VQIILKPMGNSFYFRKGVCTGPLHGSGGLWTMYAPLLTPTYFQKETLRCNNPYKIHTKTARGGKDLKHV